MTEVEALKNWVAAQNDGPKLHINGNDHPTALVVVDFGQSLRGTSMTSERNAEVGNLLRAAAKSLTRRRGQVRAQYDNHHGVYWASIS
jgi:uncharacterized protein involved in propanediol utilization